MTTLIVFDETGAEITREAGLSTSPRISLKGAADQRQLHALGRRFPEAKTGKIGSALFEFDASRYPQFVGFEGAAPPPPPAPIPAILKFKPRQRVAVQRLIPGADGPFTKDWTERATVVRYMADCHVAGYWVVRFDDSPKGGGLGVHEEQLRALDEVAK